MRAPERSTIPSLVPFLLNESQELADVAIEHVIVLMDSEISCEGKLGVPATASPRQCGL